MGRVFAVDEKSLRRYREQDREGGGERCLLYMYR